MFSMQQVGMRITELRKARHMTQQELADRMHISFQAVSNWERGSSMPDISKLPELAQILGVSIDHILMETSPVTASATEAKADVLPPCIVIPEAKDTAPRQNDSGSPADFPEGIQDLASLIGFAPFLSQETIDQIALEIAQRSMTDDFGVLTGLAPFLSENVLSTLALHMAEQAGQVPDIGLLTGLAPFLDDNTTSRIALHIAKDRPFHDDITLALLTGLAPFLEEDTLNQIALYVVEQQPSSPSNSLQILTGLAPFLDEAAMDAIAVTLLHNSQDPVCMSTIVSLAPFMEEQTLGTIVDIVLSRNTPMDGKLLQQLAPFLPEETVDKLALYICRQGHAGG